MRISAPRHLQLHLSDAIVMVIVPAAGALGIRAYGLLDGSSENIYLLTVFSVIPGAVAALRHVNKRRIAGFVRCFNLVFIMTFFLGTGVVLAKKLEIDLRGRMQINQTAAVASCKAFAEAEEIYRRTDYDGDGVPEYAQTLRELLNRGGGCCCDICLIDKSFASAEGLPGIARPKAGYVFKVLTAQGLALPVAGEIFS
jgi:hypothetical protein